jgi:hypothetical protein
VAYEQRHVPAEIAAIHQTVAVAQKVGVVETAAELLKRRAGESRPEDLKQYLAAAPHVPPMPGDEIDS